MKEIPIKMRKLLCACKSWFMRFPALAAAMPVARFSRHATSSIKSSKVKACHIDNRGCAGEIIGMLEPHLNKNTPVWEMYPGMGMLTKALLNAGCSKICAWEPRPEHYNIIQKLRKKYPKRLDVFNVTVFSSKNKMSWVSENLVPVPWKSEAAYQVIGCLQKHDLIRFTNQLHKALGSRQNSYWFNFGRVEYFLFVPHREYLVMTGEDEKAYQTHWPLVASMPLFYNTQLITKVPVGNFQPRQVLTPGPAKRGNIKNTGIHDLEHFYFVKFTPKPELYDIYSEEELGNFVHFMTLLKKATKMERLIPLLEKWYPGIGVELIKKDFTMYDTVGSISRQHLYPIFKSLVHHPNYRDGKYDMDGQELFKRSKLHGL